MLKPDIKGKTKDGQRPKPINLTVPQQYMRPAKLLPVHRDMSPDHHIGTPNVKVSRRGTKNDH